MLRLSLVLLSLVGAIAAFAEADERNPAAASWRSHPPQRPTASLPRRQKDGGPARFVDAQQGDDQHDGSEAHPWRSLQHALRQLRPGDTLYLRAGTYYERPSLSRSGTAEAPISIRSYPGETAIIDGGLREFWDDPAGSWLPLESGAAGEFISRGTYFDLAERRPPHQFLPASWEPLWGIEEQRPLALGHFGDSLVPLHGYRFLSDLRADNELWIGDKKSSARGMYCGPGLWFDRETGRIHIRLAHHTLPGLGERAYRGETDPRKLPLVVAVGFGRDVLSVCGVHHVRIRDLVFRGATGSPMIHVYGSTDLELDRLTVYGGFPGLLINASQRLKVTNSAFRGLAAPWSGRAHMKYRGTASYQIVLQNNQPVNEDLEFAHCEFTDDHDFAFLRYVKDLRLHHCYIDNFNDDGLECGPKLRDHTLYIYQNHIGSCLGIFQQHEIDQDESPRDHTAGSGVYVYRNVIDSRQGVPYQHPQQPDPSGEFLHAPGVLLGDHGGPVYPLLRFYHNTVLREVPVFRNAYLFGLGGLRPMPTERDVFNNLFVQRQGPPGIGFVALQDAGPVREGGNLLWSYGDEISAGAQALAKFRASPLFEKSKQSYAAGWTTDDLLLDPKLVRPPTSRISPCDLRLQPGSPAIDAGLTLPEEWPDPLREANGRGDLGALPLGTEAWGVGIDGRIPLFER